MSPLEIAVASLAYGILNLWAIRLTAGDLTWQSAEHNKRDTPNDHDKEGAIFMATCLVVFWPLTALITLVLFVWEIPDMAHVTIGAERRGRLNAQRKEQASRITELERELAVAQGDQP
jgi:hypothetical protein